VTKKIEVGEEQYVQVVNVTALKKNSSLAFEVGLSSGGVCSGFFARESNMELHAYENHCPHTGAPLNWTPDQFLTKEGLYIQCSIHGAMFKIQDGECFAGPCSGRFLKKIRVVEKSGIAYVALLDIEKNPP